jgi:2-polyprenyl-3-methyl-5-hydroxy-6-metoxy-1,4-benzoquinol methylase
MEDNYRTRIYRTYLSAQKKPQEPPSIKVFNPRRPYLKKLVRKHFPNDRNASILDLGCGHGTLIYCSIQEGYRNVRGVDRSQEQVWIAKSLRIKGIEHCDAMETLANEPVKAVDCIVAFDLIEHFKRNELFLFIDEIRRVLKPGGRLIIHTPNGESPFGMRIRYGDLTHELAFTQSSLSQLLLSSGFSKVDCYEDQPIPHGVKSTIRWFLWKVIRSLLFSYIIVETGDIDRDAIFSQNFLAVAYK